MVVEKESGIFSNMYTGEITQKNAVKLKTEGVEIPALLDTGDI